MWAAPALEAATGAVPRPGTVTTMAGSKPSSSNWLSEVKPWSSPFPVVTFSRLSLQFEEVLVLRRVKMGQLVMEARGEKSTKQRAIDGPCRKERRPCRRRAVGVVERRAAKGRGGSLRAAAKDALVLAWIRSIGRHWRGR